MVTLKNDAMSQRGLRWGFPSVPFMLSICTSDAVVVSTSSNHLAWLGRCRDDVVGHRCSEWASPQHWDLNWYLFQRSAATGVPLAWDRSVLRADGASMHGHVMVRPIRTRKHRLMMLCANSVVVGNGSAHLAVDVRECLADLAHVAPVAILQPSFEELASYAAEAASQALGRLH